MIKAELAAQPDPQRVLQPAQTPQGQALAQLLEAVQAAAKHETGAQEKLERAAATAETALSPPRPEDAAAPASASQEIAATQPGDAEMTDTELDKLIATLQHQPAAKRSRVAERLRGSHDGA